MAIEQAKKFMVEMFKDEKAREMVKSMKAPQNEDEAVKAYAEVARKLGYDVTEEDLAELIGELKQKQAEATEKAIEDEEEISTENLEAVAGGVCGDPAYIVNEASKITCDDFLDVVGQAGKKAICGTFIWS